MAVHGRLLLISGLVIVTVSLASSKSQQASQHNPGVVPPSICSGDYSYTKGYRCQDYDVITEDGYILRLWRFREGRSAKSKREGKKQAVFVQHGVLMNGQSWFVVSHADQSLPLVLVEEGYDVWVSNSRGTSYSERIVSSNSNNLSLPAEYWDFSFSEMATYDLPAFLKFVCLETGQKVHYIGHSQGTTMMFAAFSEWDIEARIKSATLLAPVVYINHMPHSALLKILAEARIGEIAGSFGIPYLNIMTQPLGAIIRALCDVPGVDCFDWLVTLFAGQSCCLNASTVELWFGVLPQPTSIKNLVHWAQGVREPVFAHFDYGDPATNLEHYGVPEPPSYNFLKIPKDFPLFIVYGGPDLLSIREDVHILLNKLGSHRNIRTLYMDNYAHLDFFQGITAKDHVYPDVINFIRGIP